MRAPKEIDAGNARTASTRKTAVKRAPAVTQAAREDVRASELLAQIRARKVELNARIAALVARMG